MKSSFFPKDLILHHIEVDDADFFIDGDTGTISEETKLTKDILELASHCSEDEIHKRLSSQYADDMIQDELAEIQSAIENKIIGNKEVALYQESEVQERDWLDSKILANLWINISNDCNMRCVYCFENGGNYGKEKKIMNHRILKDGIDFWYRYLNKDEKNVYVIFFGGEPLYNKQGIEFAFHYICKLLAPHGITPHYSLTTNATLLDKKFVEFLVENRIPVTISIDGGADIQNKNRPLVSGQASYKLVEKNLKHFFKLRKNVTARVTLIHEDVDNLCKIVKDLWDLGFCQVQYDLAASNNPRLKFTMDDLDILRNQIRELADLTYQNIIAGNWKVLRNLTKAIQCINIPRRDLTGCSIYTPYTVMLDPSGEIYKCQRLMEQKYCIGDIYRGIEWTKFYTIKKANHACEVCWAKAICNEGCPQVKLVHTGDMDKNYELWCNHTKIHIEEAIRIYIKLYRRHPEIFADIKNFKG